MRRPTSVTVDAGEDDPCDADTPGEAAERQVEHGLGLRNVPLVAVGPRPVHHGEERQQGYRPTTEHAPLYGIQI